MEGFKVFSHGPQQPHTSQGYGGWSEVVAPFIARSNVEGTVVLERCHSSYKRATRVRMVKQRMVIQENKR